MHFHSDEEIPGFNLHTSFQANFAFLVASFMLMCSLAWTLRDHRRRLLEISADEQEDILYLTSLGILFVCAALGSYFAFNTTRIDASGRAVAGNLIVEELVRGLWSLRDRTDMSFPPFSPDLPVALPMPSSDVLARELARRKDASGEYTWMSVGVFALVLFAAVYYFYPSQKEPIAPPPSVAAASSQGPQQQSASTIGEAEPPAASPSPDQAGEAPTEEQEDRPPERPASPAAATAGQQGSPFQRKTLGSPLAQRNRQSPRLPGSPTTTDPTSGDEDRKPPPKIGGRH